MLNTSIQFVVDNNGEIVQNTSSVFNTSQHVATNTLQENGCMEVRFSQMGYIPWDNPDNIVSADAERIAHRLKDNLLGCLFLIGGPANVINMAVFYKQSLKDRVNLCLFALALADELLLSLSMLFHGEQLYMQFTTKERYGPTLTFLTNNNLAGLLGFCFVSPVLSAIIAMERCYCVLRPLKFQTLMRTRTMAAIIIVVYFLVLGLFFIVGFRYRIGCLHDPETGVVLKTAVTGEFYQKHKQLIDILDGFVFGVGLPGLVLITVIISTIITVVKLRQIVTWRSETSSSLSPREVALTKMLVGNSILFIVSVSPTAMIHFSWFFLPGASSGGRKHNFFLTSLWTAEICTFVNATFNIFVYYAMGSRYRETFWALLGRKQMSDNSQETLHPTSTKM